MGTAFAIAEAVLAGLGAVLAGLGAVMLITGWGPWPGPISPRFPLEPATARDRRLRGLVGVFGGGGIFLQALSVIEIDQYEFWFPLQAVALLLLGAALVVHFSIRYRDRRSAEVLSGWQRIARDFRS